MGRDQQRLHSRITPNHGGSRSDVNESLPSNKMAHSIPTTVDTAEGIAQLLIREVVRLRGVSRAIPQRS